MALPLAYVGDESQVKDLFEEYSYPEGINAGDLSTSIS